MSKKYFYILPAILFACILTTEAFAQSTPTDLTLPEAFPQIQQQLDITVTPQNPKSGDIVTINVEAYDLDLNTRLITWTLNGQQALRGIGQKKFAFNVGQAGSVTKVSLSIVTKYGSEVVRDFTFSPVDVDLLWQANTYTPPFYKGKALYTPESNVMFVAIPNIIKGGRIESAADNVYNWSVDYDAQADKSGFGRNTFDFTGPIFIRPTTVTATVYSSVDPTLKGTGKTTISPESPSALIYEDSPLLGVLFNRSISGQFTMQGNSVSVSAYPYFFTTPNKNSVVAYDWLLDSSPITLPSTQNSLILRRPPSGGGNSSILLDVTNETKILQAAAAAFNVLFDQNSSLGN
jgi:hypothetical protein